MEKKMKRKCLLVLILAVVSVGMVFADVDADVDTGIDFSSMPKNTITVDIGPSLIGLAFTKMGEMLGGTEVDITGFGIAAQYERQVQEKTGVGLRFAYLGFGMGMDDDGAKATVEFASFSIEAHIRYYPVGESFFIDGMLGYGNLAMKISGEQNVEEEGRTLREKVEYTVPRDYFKFGGKIGWRVDFGNPGGFIFEPSFGYYFCAGLGDTLGEKMVNEIGGDPEEAGGFGPLFYYLENLIFIGGPRLSLAFGFRF
jgi:hypothetical protein